MSGLLRVRVNVAAGGPGLDEGIKIVGNIHATAPGSRGQRSVLFPLGTQAPPAEFSVEAGGYLVEATLPSGVLLAEQVHVAEGASATVELEAPGEPDESRSLQYVLGNVLPAPAPPVRIAPPQGDLPGRYGIPHPSPRTEPPKLVRLRTEASSAASYRSLNELAGLPPADAASAVQSAMVPTGPPEDPVPAQGDDAVAIYRVRGGAAPANGPVPSRDFLLVEAAGHRLLAVLPTPWPDARGRDTAAEVVVHLRPRPAASRVSVTVRDPDLTAGLAYLAAGNLAKAAAVFAAIEGLLYAPGTPDAVANPLAAVAACYLFLGTGSPGTSAGWTDRVPDLSRQLPLFGDGPILQAALQLREATTARDEEAAKQLAKAAFRRGLPAFTLGLSWLVDLLAEFPEDAECEAMLAQVRRLAWRAEMREAFVVLELGGNRDD